jgi:membrane protease YdiL (CAAX protease family)
MMFSFWNLYIRFVVSLILLFVIEILTEKFQKEKRRKIKQRLSPFFNWAFPSNKPFRLFCLPLIFILILESLFLKQTIDIYLFLFSFTFLTQPLTEEIIFRGVLFGYLIKKSERGKQDKKKYIMYIMLSLIFQSLLFTSIHWETKLTAIPSVFLSGIIYGIIFMLSGRNVLVSTIMHIASNLFVFIFGL